MSNDRRPISSGKLRLILVVPLASIRFLFSLYAVKEQAGSLRKNFRRVCFVAGNVLSHCAVLLGFAHHESETTS